MIFVDSNIPMYLVGDEHPNKSHTNEILPRLLQQREPLVTSIEVYQEMLHRYTPTRHFDAMDDAFKALDDIIDDVLTFGIAEIRAAREIVHSIPGLSARDALHVAVMNSAGISRILSFDRGFDLYPGIERIS